MSISSSITAAEERGIEKVFLKAEENKGEYPSSVISKGGLPGCLGSKGEQGEM